MQLRQPRIALLGLASVLLAPLAPAAGSGTPPNILVIVADDLGVEILGGYGPQPDQPPTPVLDQLVLDGVRFENAWASPICTPTRAEIQTGRHALRTGMGSLLGGIQDTPFGDYGLPLDEITIPEMLDLGAPAVWEHACIGKWHMASKATGGLLAPNMAGYDHFAGLMGNIIAPETYESWERVVDGIAAPETGYATSVQVDDALAWIGQTTGSWFCIVNFSTPHLPFHEPPAALHTQDLSTAGDPIANPRPYYKAMVEAMDTEIGRLLTGLGTQASNTMVFFLGDNGTPAKAAGPPLDELHAKGSFFEGGVQVPLIAKGPLVGTAGSSSDALVDVTDLWATVADIAGIDPATVLPVGETLDGISLVPYLADATTPSVKDHIFTEIFRPNSEDGGLPVYFGTGPVCQEDLGFGGPGDAVLSVCGDPLAPGNFTDVLVTGAPPLAPAWLAGSFQANPIPIGGGFLVPNPETFVQPVFTDAKGEIFIPDLTSSLGPLEYYAQFAIVDPSQPFGFAITNAVRLEFLPTNTKAVRGERYKLVRIFNGGADELYDLQTDPYEAVNLLTAGPPLTTEQDAAYQALIAELDAFIQSF
ncbi:MAG: sulfatase-like hydrolase/transferase [Planctomycetota bacterium]